MDSDIKLSNIFIYTKRKTETVSKLTQRKKKWMAEPELEL